MLRFVIYICKLHIHNMFDEIPVMASRGPFKGLFKYLHFPHCFLIIFILKVSFNFG